MVLILIRIGLFSLIPVGIFVLIKTLGMTKKIFNGNIILEIPFTQKEATFQVPKNGAYAVWQKGQLFRKTPVDQFEIQILRERDGTVVSLSPSFMRPNTSNFDTGRMEMKRFSAESGSYKLILRDGPGISSFEKGLSNLIPAKEVDYNKYFIQVRETGPAYHMFLAIPLFLLSGFMILGGFVLGLLAQQIFV